MTLRYAYQQFIDADVVRASENCGCVNDMEPSDEELESIIDAASDILAQMSWGRMRGRGSVTVRPCRSDCWECCPCCGLDGVPLWGPDPVITTVKIDGDAMDAADYGIHSTRAGWKLVKLGTGERPTQWPSWQDLWKPDTEDGTFSITYVRGAHLDWFAQQAALELVCYFANLDARKRTALQKGVVSANYNSTSVTIDERRSQANAGVGEAMTAFLNLYGQPPSYVYAPELDEGWNLTVVTA